MLNMDNARAMRCKSPWLLQVLSTNTPAKLTSHEGGPLYMSQPQTYMQIASTFPTFVLLVHVPSSTLYDSACIQNPPSVHGSPPRK